MIRDQTHPSFPRAPPNLVAAVRILLIIQISWAQICTTRSGCLRSPRLWPWSWSPDSRHSALLWQMDREAKEHPAEDTHWWPRHERLGPDKAVFMTPHTFGVCSLDSEDWRQWERNEEKTALFTLQPAESELIFSLVHLRKFESLHWLWHTGTRERERESLAGWVSDSKFGRIQSQGKSAAGWLAAAQAGQV